MVLTAEGWLRLDALVAQAAKRAVEIGAGGNEYTPVGHVVDERSFVNAVAGLLAKADLAAPRDERIPESLHRIVDVTRYACNRSERGNAATSRWAYTMLHRHYGDTPWATETPYWYDKLKR